MEVEKYFPRAGTSLREGQRALTLTSGDMGKRSLISSGKASAHFTISYENSREAAIEKYGTAFFSEENNFGAPFPLKAGEVRTEEYPTWWEFIQWLIGTRDHPER